MDSGIGTTLRRPIRGTETKSTSVLLMGMMMVGTGIFSLVISISIRNTDPSDFFYDIDNEASTMFAAFGAVILIIGLVLIGLSFKLKNDERMRTEEELKAHEAARERDLRDLANAVKSNIRVRCRYCGTLNEEAASKCISCGAAL